MRSFSGARYVDAAPNSQKRLEKYLHHLSQRVVGGKLPGGFKFRIIGFFAMLIGKKSVIKKAINALIDWLRKAE